MGEETTFAEIHREEGIDDVVNFSSSYSNMPSSEGNSLEVNVPESIPESINSSEEEEEMSGDIDNSELCVYVIIFCLLLYMISCPMYLILMFIVFVLWHRDWKPVVRALKVIKRGLINIFLKLRNSKTTRVNVVKRPVTQKQMEHAKKDLLFEENDQILLADENVDTHKATYFNYKVKTFIPDLNNCVYAELDSDSHLSLVSTEFFDKLRTNSEIRYLDEPKTSFQGLGSSLESKHNTFLLDLQIGKSLFENRFVVCDNLKSSPILLGSDFSVKYKVSVTPYSDGSWMVNVGPCKARF